MPESAFPQAVILTAATQTATFGVSGYGGIGIQIQGTFVGTLTFEGSVDGAEFAALAMTSADDPTTVVTTATAPGVFVGSVAGLTTVRARMSAYTSGSASVLSRAVLESPGGAAGGGGGGGGLDELTGDVTAGPGTGAQAATIAAGAVTLAKMADLAQNRLIGRTTASTGVPEAIAPGTGVLTALQINVGSAGAPVLFNGALGTPSSGVGTNLTGTAAGLTAGTASAVAIGGVTGLGTGVATALAINVGTAGAIAAFQFIEEQTPTSTGTLTFSSLGAFTHLEIVYSARGTQAAAATSLQIRFNADSGSNYDTQQVQGNGAVPSASEAMGSTTGFIGAIAAASATAAYAGSGKVRVIDYRGTTLQKTWIAENTYRSGTGGGGAFALISNGGWRNASAITSITILLASGNYDTGTKFTLYGMR